MTRPDDIQTVTDDRAPLIERVGAFLCPAVFFCAIAVGFLASALAGQLSTQHSMFREFLRISRPIGAETFFNIPAMQIYRLLDEIPSEKILVVLGGSSRFHGAGQTTRGLWSRHLQERLGPRFAVVNLAQPAGGTDQFGSHAVEAMIKAGRPVVFVADVGLNNLEPLGMNRAYWYFFYDSLSHDLLLKSPIRDQQVEMTGLQTISSMPFTRPRQAA